MKEAAIVSLAIGDEHLAYWRRYCEATWKAYVQKCGYDMIMVTEPIDRSPAAATRSPAWQKCLILSQPFAADYRQIIWLDCDIAINASAAPRITDQAPLDRLSGVISGSHVHEDLRPVLLHRLRGNPVPYERGLRQWQEDQAAYYAGLPERYGGIVQTGVLVASPQHHRTLFEAVYRTAYPENRNYEQLPLSYAALSTGVFHPIDTRFNSVFFETMLVHYPYLLSPQFPQPLFDVAAACAVQTEFANNFFLHFAYNRDFARHLAPTTATA
jgi:hypothetical protein